MNVTDSLISSQREFEIPPPLSLASLRSIIEKHHSNATMSSNLKNDGLVCLRNDDLDCDGLPMVFDDNCEFDFEGKSYRSYTDYVQAKRSRTAGIFTNSGIQPSRRRGPPLLQGGQRIPGMIWRYRRCCPDESQVALPGQSAKASILLNSSGRMIHSSF
jgi:hypothetical protein